MPISVCFGIYFSKFSILDFEEPSEKFLLVKIIFKLFELEGSSKSKIENCEK